MAANICCFCGDAAAIEESSASMHTRTTSSERLTTCMEVACTTQFVRCLQTQTLDVRALSIQEPAGKAKAKAKVKAKAKAKAKDKTKTDVVTVIVSSESASGEASVLAEGKHGGAKGKRVYPEEKAWLIRGTFNWDMGVVSKVESLGYLENSNGIKEASASTLFPARTYKPHIIREKNHAKQDKEARHIRNTGLYAPTDVSFKQDPTSLLLMLLYDIVLQNIITIDSSKGRVLILKQPDKGQYVNVVSKLKGGETNDILQLLFRTSLSSALADGAFTSVEKKDGEPQIDSKKLMTFIQTKCLRQNEGGFELIVYSVVVGKQYPRSVEMRETKSRTPARAVLPSSEWYRNISNPGSVAMMRDIQKNISNGRFALSGAGPSSEQMYNLLAMTITDFTNEIEPFFESEDEDLENNEEFALAITKFKDIQDAFREDFAQIAINKMGFVYPRLAPPHVQGQIVQTSEIFLSKQGIKLTVTNAAEWFTAHPDWQYECPDVRQYDAMKVLQPFANTVVFNEIWYVTQLARRRTHPKDGKVLDALNFVKAQLKSKYPEIAATEEEEEDPKFWVGQLKTAIYKNDSALVSDNYHAVGFYCIVIRKYDSDAKDIPATRKRLFELKYPEGRANKSAPKGKKAAEHTSGSSGYTYEDVWENESDQ